MALNTPAIYARGVFELDAPYAALLVPNRSYTCVAIRGFRDIRAAGDDVFALYYQPRGVDLTRYQNDDAASASIVTLYSEDQPMLHVPNSFIKSYPTTVTNGFSRVIMGVEIGLVPDDLPLDYLISEIQGKASELTGLTAEVTLHTAPYQGVLTAQQLEAFENNRKAAIGNRVTVYGKLAAAEAEVQRLTAIKEQYEKVIAQQGLKV